MGIDAIPKAEMIAMQCTCNSHSSAGEAIQPQILNLDTAIILCTKTNLPFFMDVKKRSKG